MSTNEIVSPETAPVHQPYISDSDNVQEFTLIPVIVGAILGIIFGASSLYLVLKVGMTISASIPVAVISITLFRIFSRIFGVRQATILENNIVQTTGSAGESIAFGVGVTMPALMMLGYDMDFWRVMIISSFGGLLGVLMMIPLRRGLIVKQHGKLAYPEGTACAKVLIVGEQGGTNAKTVFTGFGLGFLYKFFMVGMRLWAEIPSKILKWHKGTEIAGEFSPELLGVGYIIGPATGCVMMAGGVLSTLVLIPLIKLFGEGLTTPIYPANILISAMQTEDIWKSYILYIGAGAVATGGIISLFSSLPLIYSSFLAGLRDINFSKSEGAAMATKIRRTEHDLPMSFVIIGSLLLILAIKSTPILNVDFVGAVLIVLFGFLFVTVSSRLTGEIGSSSNPISGMTVSTLLLTCLIFLGMGWTGVSYRLSALSIAAVVCIAASNGGTTSQDLKTGFLVGATPRYQQLALLVGAFTSAIVIGWTLLAINSASTIYAKPPIPIIYKDEDITNFPKEKVQGPEAKSDDREYLVLRLAEPSKDGQLKPGKYLLDSGGNVAYVVDPGINGVIKHRDSERIYEAPPPNDYIAEVVNLHGKERLLGPSAEKDKNEYRVLILENDSKGLTAGKYLVREDGTVAYAVKNGTEVTKYNSPKARLMAMIIDGILTQKLPWTLVLIGVFIAIVLEFCRISSLPFAVGVYLPFSSSVPIFIGGLIRWLVDRTTRSTEAESESSPGVFLASGIIAGGSIAGILTALLAVNEGWSRSLNMGKLVTPTDFPELPGLISTVLFVTMGLFLFYSGWKGLKKSK